MASTLKFQEAEVVAGKYLVRSDFDASEDNQLNLKENQVVVVQTQAPERGWIWAQISTGTQQAGYVPLTYLQKLPEGDLDQWAYGCEIVSCFYAFFSGMFILLYGSAQKVDPTVDLVLGAMGMIFASLFMVVIFFRSDIEPLYRAGALFITVIPLLAGFPIGLWGSVTLLLTICVEVAVWYFEDEKYTPPAFSISNLCQSIFGATVLNMLMFSIWVAANILIFILGAEKGKRQVADWGSGNNDTVYQISESEWSFTQGCAYCIMFQICCLLIFALQGFQHILLIFTDFETARSGKWAKFKAALHAGLSRESMTKVHRFIAFTMMIFATLHVMGAFAAYESSGPTQDYDRLFGNAPTYSGGLLIILIGIVISSAFISHERRPRTFRYVHFTSVLFILFVLIHGRGWFGPSFWKWLITPLILFCLDKAFRFGVFGIVNTEETAAGSEIGAPSQAYQGDYEARQQQQYEQQGSQAATGGQNQQDRHYQ